MSQSTNKEIYKSSQAVASGYAFEQISKVETEVASELRAEIAKFRDPVVFASLMYRTVRERESSNMILKNILTKLEGLEARIDAMEHKTPAAPSHSIQKHPPVLLADIDQDITNFVKAKGHVCAEDVQEHFSYKGKNAASARLNRLCELNLLEKQQVGRKVYFRVRG